MVRDDLVDLDARLTGSPQLLDEQIPGSDVASITFSSIVQTTYRHLEVIGLLRGSTAANLVNTLMRFNGDTGNNYDYLNFIGFGLSTGSFLTEATSSLFVGEVAANSATANRVGNFHARIPGYRSAWHKEINVRNGVNASTTDGDHRAALISGLWKSTAAITSITIFCSAGNIKAGSIFSLYGVP